MTTIPEDIIQLLVSYSQGQLSAEEHEVLTRWMKENFDSDNFASDYAHLINDIRTLGVYEGLDVNSAWENVDKHTSDRTAKKKKRRLHFLKYAATLLLPIIASVSLFWHLSNRDQLEDNPVFFQKNYTEAVSPILMVDGGERIILDAKENHTIHSIEGELLTKDSAKVLRYVDNIKAEVKINELWIPKGANYTLILSDGTKVWLNSQTLLRYPTRFEGNERNICLLEGEIYLDVAEDKEKPFIIEGNNYNVRVLGTEFNVRNYHNESACLTTLVHGSVEIESGLSKQSVIITPDQQVRIDTDGAMAIQEVNAQQYIGWINGVLYYEHATLEKILKDLSRWYRFDYEFEEEVMSELPFAGSISRTNTIEQIIEIISSTNKLKATINEGVITFTYQ